MDITNKEIIELINLLGNKGLGFFALYIIYHYTGQIVGVVVILSLAKFCVKTVDGWIQRYLDIKEKK